MVCVEELCSIFKNLHPHKRIELMCGLLQCCVPLELRFIGSYVENLGRRDFHYLREYELKANSCPEINKLFEASQDVTRHKLAVYLSLLHTSNSACSKLCFDLLISLNTCLIPTYANPVSCKKANIDVMLELLTVLVMGINHPAFTFEQRCRLYDIYRWLEARVERLSPLSMDKGGADKFFSLFAYVCQSDVDFGDRRVSTVVLNLRLKDNPPGADPVYPCGSPPGSVFTSPDEPVDVTGHIDTFIPPVDPHFNPSGVLGLSREPPRPAELNECPDPLLNSPSDSQMNSLSGSQMNSPASSQMNSPKVRVDVLHSPVEPRAIPAYRSGGDSPEEDMSPRVELGQSPGQSDSPLHCNPPEKVFIRRVEVKGSRRTDRKQEFRMEVTWSNGEMCEVYKSYQELYEFHTKLVQLFPEDASVHKQDRKLPFLTGNPHTSNREDKTDQTSVTIANYVRKLVSLQRDILGCDHVIHFFRESQPLNQSPPSGPSSSDINLQMSSPDGRPNSAYALEINCGPNPHTVVNNSRQNSSPSEQLPVSSPASPQSRLPAVQQTSPSESVLSSRSSVSTQISPNRATQPSHDSPSQSQTNHSQISPSPLSPQVSPNPPGRPVSSPLSSPNQPSQMSPQMKPREAQLPSTHVTLPPRQRSLNQPVETLRSPSPKYSETLPTIQQLLEDLQLSHYGDSFNSYSTWQLLNFKEEDFRVFKLSSHAQKRLKTKLEQLSRVAKLPNGITPEGAVNLSLHVGTGARPADPPLPPDTLYTSTASIGQLTGSDAGNSSFESSRPDSPCQANPSQTIALSKSPIPSGEPHQMADTQSTKDDDHWDTPKVNPAERSRSDAVEVDVCDRASLEPLQSSQFDTAGKQGPGKGLGPGRVVVLACPKTGGASSQGQPSEEEVTEPEEVPSQARLSVEPNSRPSLIHTEVPHIYQSGYISDPAHPYPPHPAFPRFPPMYPMGPPQPAHLPIQMYQKVTLPPEHIHSKMTGHYMQSFMQPPHSRSDTSSLPNTVMTVTVNSVAYNNPLSDNTSTAHPPAPITSSSSQNPVNPRFALPSSMNSAGPYSSVAPPMIHRKTAGTQNSTDDSGMSSPATTLEAVSYVTGQPMSTSVGNTPPPYSPSAVQAPLLGVHSSCSSCGCRGRCGGAPSYSAAYGGYVHTQVNMPPLVHIPTFLPPNSNGLLPSPCLPPNCPIPFHNNPLQNVPNGIVPEHYSYHMSHAAAGHTPNLWNSMLYGYSSHANSSGPRNNKSKETCYNCGGSGHEAHDCRDASMESASGQYSLNFRPDLPE